MGGKKTKNKMNSKSSKLKVKEKDLQKTIIEWLKWNKSFFWRNNSGAMISEYKGVKRFMRFGSLGSPDIFILAKGCLYGIECKGSDRRLSINQSRYQTEFEKAGGIYILAYDLYDVVKRI